MKTQNIEIINKREIITLLRELDIRPHYIGYEYIKTALLCLLKDKCYLKGVNKKLYPEIAKEYKTTYKRVDRAIRNAIENAYSMKMCKLLRMWPNRPANIEFLGACLEKLELDRLKQSA